MNATMTLNRLNRLQKTVNDQLQRVMADLGSGRVIYPIEISKKTNTDSPSLLAQPVWEVQKKRDLRNALIDFKAYLKAKVIQENVRLGINAILASSEALELKLKLLKAEEASLVANTLSGNSVCINTSNFSDTLKYLVSEAASRVDSLGETASAYSLQTVEVFVTVDDLESIRQGISKIKRDLVALEDKKFQLNSTEIEIDVPQVIADELGL